jgi:cell division protein FtsB
VTEPGGRAAATGPAGRAARPGGPRPHVTGRAAILAVVICAIALSLAYPVREYIAQRRQIDQLLDRHSQIDLRLKKLEQQRQRLNDPVYIEQLARDRLHMCLPTQMCYEIISPARGSAKSATAQQDAVPWYARLWSSVQQANDPHSSRAGGATGRSAARPPGRARPG